MFIGSQAAQFSLAIKHFHGKEEGSVVSRAAQFSLEMNSLRLQLHVHYKKEGRVVLRAAQLSLEETAGSHYEIFEPINH